MAALILFDTDVLIDFLRGEEGARAEVTAVPVAQRSLSAVTHMELLRGARDARDRDSVDRFVEASFGEIQQIDEGISREATTLVRAFGLSHGLRIPDALVAATAATRGLRLVTGNLRHFQFIPNLNAELPAYRRA